MFVDICRRGFCLTAFVQGRVKIEFDSTSYIMKKSLRIGSTMITANDRSKSKDIIARRGRVNNNEVSIDSNISRINNINGRTEEQLQQDSKINAMMKIIDQMFDDDDDQATSPSASNSNTDVIQQRTQNQQEIVIPHQQQQHNDVEMNQTLSKTMTKSSWCLRIGVKHLIVADYHYKNNIMNQKNVNHEKNTTKNIITVQKESDNIDETNNSPTLLFDYVKRDGLPTFYSLWNNNYLKCKERKRHNATQDIKDPQTSYESLCRIIIGQMVSVKGAQAIWIRFCNHVTQYHDNNQSCDNDRMIITPQLILKIVQQEQGNNDDDNDESSRKQKRKRLNEENHNNLIIEDQIMEENFQKPIGLTKNKAKSIIDLSLRYVDGTLSEEFFLLVDNNDTIIRNTLLQIKGIGPWTCDMYMMFNLERSNILPLQDLGIQKGLQHYFGFNDLTTNKSKTNKKKKNDIVDTNESIRKQLSGYEPYHSLLSYYLWRIAEDKSISSPPK